MSSNKSFAFALCLVVTGCAQTPHDGSAQGSSSWWPFGADKVAEKAPDQAAAAKTDVKAAAPAVKADVVAAKTDVKADAKSTATAAATPAAPAPAANDSETHWWWPFPSSAASKEQKDAAKPLLAVRAEPVPMPDPKVTQAWLDDYEPRLRVAIKDSPFELERRDNVLVITAPIDSSFNPNRPTMLMPVTLAPITRLAKIVEADPKTAVLILGHADSGGVTEEIVKLSQDRAGSVAAIFRLSGLERNRLGMRGLGSVMPRAANDSPAGRKLNRRIEILMTPQVTMVALLSKYNMPAPAAMPAPTPLMAVTPAPVAKPAATTKKTAAKKAPAKKPAAKKAPVKKATPAKKTDPAAPAVPADQAKVN
ncbi:OmpA family protein [Pseudomonas sp. NA-150]|uniref:OmpA family protein n=1 Tax=Pseudomonas sp. NA-150 TaxID=3367525 RepID=UPI0037CA84A6